MTTIAAHKKAIAERMAEMAAQTGGGEFQVVDAGVCHDREGTPRVFATLHHDLVMLDDKGQEKAMSPFMMLHSPVPLPAFAASDPDFVRAVYKQLVGMAA